jgi:hypothetical protein
MATTVTKATLVAENAELKAQLEAAQASAQPVEVQPAKLTNLEKRIQRASNSTVILVNYCQPITRQDGSIVPGGIKIPGDQTFNINTGTREQPHWQIVDVQTTWFEAWNNGTEADPNPVADQLTALVSSTSWALIRVYWDFYAKPANVSFTIETNPKTGKPYEKSHIATNEKGHKLISKKIFAFETISKQDS